jgi:phosphoglycerate dehydrogenase-like enzyme
LLPVHCGCAGRRFLRGVSVTALAAAWNSRGGEAYNCALPLRFGWCAETFNMETRRLKIFCDLSATEETLSVLKNAVSPHQVVFPAKPAASVLSKSEPDPALAEADIAFGQPDATSVLQAQRLRWLHISSAGYTRYDTAVFRQAASERNLMVTNSSSVYAEPCAQHVLAFMLSQARNLPQALRAGATGDTSSWLSMRYTSTLLRGQTVLILGFGSIGRHLVDLLRPFGMQISALRRKPATEQGVAMITKEQLPLALASADHIVNLLPASDGSVRFFSSTEFAAMKRGAIFYNIGRGTTVDQDALLAALNSGHVGAAWLDVTEPEPLPPGHPLLNAPNCFITPHVAGGHQDEIQMLIRHFLGNFQRFVRDAPLRDRIM